MMICGECGAVNEAGRTVCSRCGAALPDAKPGKTGMRKFLLLTVVGLLAALLVTGAVLLLLAGGKWDLASAFAKTMKALRGGENPTQAWVFLEDLSGLLQKGDYTVTLDSGEFSLTADCSRDRHVICGTLDGMDQTLAYSLDREAFQFTVPGQFENVYGVSLKTLEELMHNPLFTGVMGSILGKMGIDVEHFAQIDLEADAGEAYNALLGSVSLRELEKMDLAGQNCQVFEITWSSDALAKFLDSVGTVPELRGLLTTLIPDPGSECRCYVNRKGYIAGLEFTSAGAQCLLTLEGRENPWDVLTLTRRSVYGETVTYTGGLVRSGTTLEFGLENPDGILIHLVYDQASGEFSLFTEKLGQPLNGTIGTGNRLELELAWETEEQGPRQLSLTAAPLRGIPEPLSENYIDLLNMNTADWTRFLLDLGVSGN